ncbi:hypothetical protein Dsin_005383 [Dipteronia sinensis]|uniref:Ubiquitin-like protease family profile domain-containing protein n=1 Tax=Dipteronia sinensis TaxID=43782 RepID=A0AAE0AWC4_9ROSI|nr:hypothetical protein Dsin_005383 [Dipteronia sinensis]
MKNGVEQADDVVDDKGAGNNVTVGDDKGAGNNVKDVDELNSVDDAFGDVDAAFQGGKGKEKDDDVGDVDAAFQGGKGEEKDDDIGDVDATFQGGKGEEKDDEVSDVNAAFEGCKGDEQEDDAGEIGKGSKEGVGSDCVVVRDAAFEGGKGSKEVVGSDCVVVADAAFDGGKGDDQEDAAVGEIGTGCDQCVGSDGVVVGDATVEGDMVEELVKKSILDLDEYPSLSVCFIAQNNPSSVVALDGADPDVEYRGIDKQRGRKRSSFYTGQILPMRHQDFVDLVNIEKWISDLTNLNIKWAIEMDTLEAMRKIEKFEQAEKERLQQTETGSPHSPQQKKDRKKKNKKISDPPLHGVNVWEDYPEFVPLNYQPSPDILRHVTGHDLLYPQPWWEMDSVLIPCHLPGHWVLCHVLFKEGKVLLFDSLNERDGTYHRLKDVRAILYLLPSLLKHAGYYEEMKMDPHASPFTVQSMRSELIPQQDDGLNAIFECWHERIAKAEETVINERENAKWLSVDYSVLMGKYQNLEAEIINLYVQIESRDNELNGPYQLVEQMQKKLMDFNIPPST